MLNAKVVSARSPLGEDRLKVVVISETGSRTTFMLFHLYEAALAHECADSIRGVPYFRHLRLEWSERRFLAEPLAVKRNRKGEWVHHD